MKRGKSKRDEPRPGGDPGEPPVAKQPGFSQRHPILRAVVIFAVLMGLFYGLIHRPSAANDDPFLALIASAAGAILKLLGQDIMVTNTTIQSIQSPSFSMGIVRGCDALEPVAAFTAAVLASPVAFRLKLPGIVIGAGALLIINLFRIVMLFFVGLHARNLFDLIHLDIWQAVFVVLAIAFWALWVQWATGRASRSRS